MGMAINIHTYQHVQKKYTGKQENANQRKWTHRHDRDKITRNKEKINNQDKEKL